MSTQTTRGHVYDGIEEFDNHMPNWWLWSFYLACIFSIGYWLHFHTLGTGDLPSEEYAGEMREAAALLEAAAANNPVTEQSLLELAANPAVIEDGRRIFEDATRCALCHKPDGSGLVGPNLTDPFWIYGGKPMDIYTSIAKGRPRGMLPNEQNGTLYVQRATAYVLGALKGRNLPGKEREPDAKQDN